MMFWIGCAAGVGATTVAIIGAGAFYAYQIIKEGSPIG